MNRRTLTCMVLAFWFGTCTSRPAKAKVTDSTPSVTIDFSPAFDSAMLVSVRREKDRPLLVFTVHDGLNNNKVFAGDSVSLSEEDWVAFIKAVDTGALRSLQPILHQGLDGIGIRASYKNGDSAHTFYCWSPQRSDNAGIYKLLDPTFLLLEKLLPARENVIENVKNYLEYGLPVKIESRKPFIARLYGDLSTGCETDLQHFLTTVPVDSSAVLDCSNFHGMGTLLYPYFDQFDRTHPKTIWVVGPGSRKQLLEAGINERKMVSSLTEALAKAK